MSSVGQALCLINSSNQIETTKVSHNEHTNFNFFSNNFFNQRSNCPVMMTDLKTSMINTCVQCVLMSSSTPTPVGRVTTCFASPVSVNWPRSRTIADASTVQCVVNKFNLVYSRTVRHGDLSLVSLVISL